MDKNSGPIRQDASRGHEEIVGALVALLSGKRNAWLRKALAIERGLAPFLREAARKMDAIDLVRRQHSSDPLENAFPRSFMAATPSRGLNALPEETLRTWLAVQQLGHFSAWDIRSVCGLSGGVWRKGHQPLSILRVMEVKGLIVDDGADGARLTDLGRRVLDAVAGHAEARDPYDRIRAAYDQVREACREWAARIYEDGSSPKFVSLFPDALPQPGDLAAPPLPGDRRLFAATGAVAPSGDDGLPARALEAIALAPMDAASLADCLGVPAPVACRAICGLAARGLVKDVSPGSSARSASWAAFCDIVANGHAVDGADEDEAAAAFVFMQDRQDPRVEGLDAPGYPAACKGSLPRHPSWQRHPMPGTSQAAILDMVGEAPASIREMADAALIDYSQARLLLHYKLERGGYVRAIPGRPIRYVSFDYAPGEEAACLAEAEPPAPGM